MWNDIAGSRLIRDNQSLLPAMILFYKSSDLLSFQDVKTVVNRDRFELIVGFV